MNTKLKNDRTIRLTKMAMLVAISVVLVSFVNFPIFAAAPFLKYDPADIPIIVGTFAFGPLAGLMITTITSIIQGTTVSSDGGLYGIIMHIIATGSFVIMAGIIYLKNKTKKGAVIALVAGTFIMVITMIFANMLITPLFTGLPLSAIMKMMPVIIAFNIIKAGGNSLITFFIYKRISHFLHK